MICTHEIGFGWSNREKEIGEQYGTFERRSAYRVCWGDLKERSHVGNLVLDGMTVLRWIFKKWGGGGGHGVN